MLGRSFYTTIRGHINIYPNQYIKLMGPGGTGKGTAMGIGRDLLKTAGYTKFAATRMSKEMFLINIAALQNAELELQLNTKKSILDVDVDSVSDIFVCASEFNSFVPAGDNDFLMMLTDLWDNLDVYDNPKITSKSVVVEYPTINILAANTPQMFNLAFPAESISTGTLSRYILVHGEPTGKKLLFTETPEESDKTELVEILQGIRETIKGKAKISSGAEKLLNDIYKEFPGLADIRFDTYNHRRMSHLLKLCLIFAAADLSTTVEPLHVINANTLLTATEVNMPNALGHFGRSKASNLMSKLLDFISARNGVTNSDIEAALYRETNNSAEIGNVLKMLYEAKQIVPKEHNNHVEWFIKPQVFPSWAMPFINEDFLTDQERDLCNLQTHKRAVA